MTKKPKQAAKNATNRRTRSGRKKQKDDGNDNDSLPSPNTLLRRGGNSPHTSDESDSESGEDNSGEDNSKDKESNPRKVSICIVNDYMIVF